MSRECSIVKDLLPLYIENMVSEETASFIEEHLQTCVECRKLFDTMKCSNIETIANEEIVDKGIVIKNIKSKLRKNKFLTVFLTILIMLGMLSTIFGYLLIEPPSIIATVDYGHSGIYSKNEMREAVDLITDKFHDFDGCFMFGLSYTNDELCEKELKIANSHAPEGVVYTDCIVFDSGFVTTVFSGGGFNPNQVYRWTWTLVRTDDGPWRLINWGYG